MTPPWHGGGRGFDSPPVHLKHSLTVGVSFGLNSGVITTLGLIVGLYSRTQSRLAVIGGIITIAIADAFSDALGIHVSEESEGVHSPGEVWLSTFATFVTKFLVAMSFLLPVLFLPLGMAVLASALWGLILVAGFSAKLAAEQGSPGIVAEHILLAVLVVLATYYTGELIRASFG